MIPIARCCASRSARNVRHCQTDHLEHCVAQNGRLQGLELHREIHSENLAKEGLRELQML